MDCGLGSSKGLDAYHSPATSATSFDSEGNSKGRRQLLCKNEIVVVFGVPECALLLQTKWEPKFGYRILDFLISS